MQHPNIGEKLKAEMEHRVEHSYDLEISIFVCATENIPKEQSEQILERLRSLTPLFSKLKWKEDKIDDMSELINYVKKCKAAIGAFDLDEHDTSHEDSEIAILKESMEKSRYEIKIEFNAESDITQPIIKHVIKLRSSLAENLAEEFYKILKEKVHVTLRTKFTYHQPHDGQDYLNRVMRITSRIHNMNIRTETGSSISGTIIRWKEPNKQMREEKPDEKGVMQKIKEWWNITHANQ